MFRKKVAETEIINMIREEAQAQTRQRSLRKSEAYISGLSRGGRTVKKLMEKGSELRGKFKSIVQGKPSGGRSTRKKCWLQRAQKAKAEMSADTELYLIQKTINYHFWKAGVGELSYPHIQQDIHPVPPNTHCAIRGLVCQTALFTHT